MDPKSRWEAKQAERLLEWTVLPVLARVACKQFGRKLYLFIVALDQGERSILFNA